MISEQNLQKTGTFLKKKFQEYYYQNSGTITPPRRFETREFAFLFFGSNFMIRHKSFKDLQNVQTFVRDKVPSDAYHSTAYYSNPEDEMARKGWKGADLVFDIDADHIATPCKVDHDVWRCRTCNRSGKGGPPDKCPNCGREMFDQEVWLCEICLEKARDELIKLVEYLEADFGIQHGEMHAYFSGHRGYHVHVASDSVQQLSDAERREIADYLTGQGFDVNLQNLRGNRLDINDIGWRGRLVQGFYEILLRAHREQLLDLGFSEVTAELLTNWANRPDTQLDLILSRVPKREEKALIELVNRAIMVKTIPIDTVVTTDVHRLIRLNGSLHSKTGFAVVEVGTNGLESFDPFSSSCVFEGEEEVYVKIAPKFRVGQETFGPYEKQKVILPTSAAVLLVAKGRAEPSGEVAV